MLTSCTVYSQRIRRRVSKYAWEKEKKKYVKDKHKVETEE